MKLIEERKRMRGQGGFTLIELLVVIAILAVLGGAAIIGIGAIRENATESACKVDVETIETAAEAYKLDAGTYPANLTALETEGLIKPKATTQARFDVSATGVTGKGDCLGTDTTF